MGEVAITEQNAAGAPLPDARLVHLVPFTIFRNTRIFLLLR
jgi:hypothetical protein